MTRKRAKTTASKPSRTRNSECLPVFQIHGGELEIVDAPLSRREQDTINALMVDIGRGFPSMEEWLADDVMNDEDARAMARLETELPPMLKRHPYNFSIINGMMLAMAEVVGAEVALHFFEKHVDMFKAFVRDATGHQIGQNAPDAIRVPAHREGNVPFLHAMRNRLSMLFESEHDKEALDTAMQLMEMDHDDTLNTRVFVLHLGIETRNNAAITRLKELITSEWGEEWVNGKDQLAAMTYGWGLHYFISGDRDKARTLFDRGIQQNPHVVKLMFQKRLPDDPDAFTDLLVTEKHVISGESEALHYLNTWHETLNNEPAALEFLRHLSLERGAHVEKVYRLTIMLDVLGPAFSRVIEIPSSDTFADLARAIRSAFGWSEGRHHAFTVNPGLDEAEPANSVASIWSDIEERITIEPAPLEDDDEEEFDIRETDGNVDDDEGDENYLDDFECMMEVDHYDEEITIEDMLSRPGARATFIHDVFDHEVSWTHRITVEDTRPLDAGPPASTKATGPAPVERAGEWTYLKMVQSGEAPGITPEIQAAVNQHLIDTMQRAKDQVASTRRKLEQFYKEQDTPLDEDDEEW